MGVKRKTEGMLRPYRVLDLTDERGLLCGKILTMLLEKGAGKGNAYYGIAKVGRLSQGGYLEV